MSLILSHLYLFYSFISPDLYFSLWNFNSLLKFANILFWWFLIHCQNCQAGFFHHEHSMSHCFVNCNVTSILKTLHIYFCSLFYSILCSISVLLALAHGVLALHVPYHFLLSTGHWISSEFCIEIFWDLECCYFPQPLSPFPRAGSLCILLILSKCSNLFLLFPRNTIAKIDTLSTHSYVPFILG